MTSRQESRVISTTEMLLTRELHIIRAHHLHYLSLLDHYTKHIKFIRNTPNPAMDGLSKEERESSQNLLNRECNNLLNEIDRLNAELSTQEKRLKNVMALVSYTNHPSVPIFFFSIMVVRCLVASILPTVNTCDIWRKLLFEIVLVRPLLFYSYSMSLMKIHLTISAVCYWSSIGVP